VFTGLELTHQIQLNLADRKSCPMLQLINQFRRDMFEDASTQVVRSVSDLTGLSTSQM